MTAGHGEVERSRVFKASNDDYDGILFKALGDRLAEALAEYTHERVRRELWGYARDENSENEELIGEKYRGIRPAPGYPAQPDHTEKGTLFQVLDAGANAGMELTESFAMMPGSSVSGLYFSHPESVYFGVGRIDRDQVEDYAKRKGMTLARPNGGCRRSWPTCRGRPRRRKLRHALGPGFGPAREADRVRLQQTF